MAAANNNNLVDTDPLSSEESSDEEEDQPAFLNLPVNRGSVMIYLGISMTYLDEMSLKKTKKSSLALMLSFPPSVNLTGKQLQLTRLFILFLQMLFPGQ